MTVLEATKLFKDEMTNEIFHYVSDDALQDSLLDALNSVYKTVIHTYEAETKSK